LFYILKIKISSRKNTNNDIINNSSNIFFENFFPQEVKTNMSKNSFFPALKGFAGLAILFLIDDF
jgi:hypothetical protein